jgi:sec-independent protein translocase protein TatB
LENSFSWGHILVLAVAALFILGPERLPHAAAGLGCSIRKMREFADGAGAQLRREIGPELDQLHQPLQQLRGLRDRDPKRAVMRYLFDDELPQVPNLSSPADIEPTSDAREHGSDRPPSGPEPRPLATGEHPPTDLDAT